MFTVVMNVFSGIASALVTIFYGKNAVEAYKAHKITKNG